jgi:hypothetical protein
MKKGKHKSNGGKSESDLPMFRVIFFWKSIVISLTWLSIVESKSKKLLLFIIAKLFATKCLNSSLAYWNYLDHAIIL